MFRVGSQNLQGARCRLKQDVVDNTFVLQGEQRDWSRERKNGVKVGYGQELCFAGIGPIRSCLSLAFWTMTVAARIVNVTLTCTVFAAILAATQFGGSTSFDRSQDTPLLNRQQTTIFLIERRTVSANDIGEFQTRGRHDLGSSLSLRSIKMSKGLLVFASDSSETWRYLAVVVMLLCPSRI